MGLAGPKKRAKLSHDPNNTAWSRDTSSYGHKILASQGWAPGDYLGAKDAAHAAHYSNANASHIRVLLKDDNLGLGAQRSAGSNAETFGLSMFAGLLGRLNGKSEDVLQKEQSKQRDVELALYNGRKYRNLNFVSAGFLVGDKIEDLKASLQAEKALKASATATEAMPNLDQQVASERAVQRERKRKRRDRTDQADGAGIATVGSITELEADDATSGTKTPEETGVEKKSSKEKRETDEGEGRNKKSKKDRTEKRSKKRKAEKSFAEDGKESSSSSQCKADKRARKEERRRTKEEKKGPASVITTIPQIADTAGVQTVDPSSDEEAAEQSKAPVVVIGRHAVRQRYIQQKRMASLNPQALKEIFMIKTPS